MRKGLLTSMGLTGLLAASLVQGAVAAQAAKLHGQAHAGESEANAIPAPPRPPFMPVQRRYARLARITTKSAARLLHREHTSRSRQSSTGVSGPYP